ncbi:transmembrane protein 254-like [Tubulanus polymorphus]|uniref:transmembrane protein 254-like n=1 Tax=Tubulanus polymorphus TaxID=672921 RepID=UPI003DA5148C
MALRRSTYLRQVHKECSSVSASFDVAPFRLDWVPCDYLGPLGKFVLFLNDAHPYNLYIIVVIIWLIHVGEGVFADKLCRERNISLSCRVLWDIQSFLLGFPSLRVLYAYKPPSSAQTSHPPTRGKKVK